MVQKILLIHGNGQQPVMEPSHQMNLLLMQFILLVLPMFWQAQFNYVCMLLMVPLVLRIILIV